MNVVMWGHDVYMYCGHCSVMQKMIDNGTWDNIEQAVSAPWMTTQQRNELLWMSKNRPYLTFKRTIRTAFVEHRLAYLNAKTRDTAFEYHCVTPSIYKTDARSNFSKKSVTATFLQKPMAFVSGINPEYNWQQFPQLQVSKQLVIEGIRNLLSTHSVILVLIALFCLRVFWKVSPRANPLSWTEPGVLVQYKMLHL